MKSEYNNIKEASIRTECTPQKTQTNKDQTHRQLHANDSQRIMKLKPFTCRTNKMQPAGSLTSS
jgi:hypothetical protein